MKKRLKEMEDEAAALREMQAKVEKEMGSVQGVSLFDFSLRVLKKLCVLMIASFQILDFYPFLKFPMKYSVIYAMD